MENQQGGEKTITFTPLAAGTEVGAYRLIRELGLGGMGQVFLAEDSRLERQVALKFLTPELAQKDDFRQRFMREAKSAAKLNHNNIVTIHDVGEALERVFISMEYVEGRTLRQMIDTRSLPYEQAIDVFTQICHGLKKAHDAGIVHRDLKPANIMVSADGQVKILDFGLAKGIIDGHLTSTGTALGTVNYMSPEQAQGSGVDHRSDLFSAGTLFFEMLGGINPFVRGHMPATIHAIVYEPVGLLSNHAPDLPTDCQTIIDKAVGKKPTDRYQSVDDLLADIECLKAGKPITPAAVAQPSVARSETTSLAVLFLRNLGNDDDEYLCHGITEDLIVDLSRLGSVKVLPMYKVVRFKDSDLDPEEIAKQLNATMILDGSLHRSGETVRISAQLVDISDDNILWSNRWEESANSLPKIKSALANGISAALEVDSSVVRKADVGKAETSNPEAYDLYLKGKFAFESRKKKADVDRARDFFNQALKLEPTMIAAKVGLAEILADESQYDEAMKVLRLALDDSRKRRLKADEARVCTMLGSALNSSFITENYEESIKRHREAIAIFRELKDINGEARALSELLKPLLNLARSDEALELEDRINQLTNEGADGRWIAQCKYFLSTAYYFFRNDMTTANHLCEEALQLSKANNFHVLTAKILSAFGAAYASRGDMKTAIAYLGEARYIADRLGDDHLILNVDFRTSVLEMSAGSLPRFYSKAIDLERRLREQRDEIGLASHLINWASVLYMMGKGDELEKILPKVDTAASVLSGQHKTAAQGSALELRAVLSLQNANREQAMEQINRAKSIMEKTESASSLAQVFTSGGEIFFDSNEIELARSWFEKGLELGKKIEERWCTTISAGYLGLMAYKQKQDPEILTELRRNCESSIGHLVEVNARRLYGQAMLEHGPTDQEREQGRRELMQALGLARNMEYVVEMNRIQEVLDRHE
jgi:serine/threonine protein kinase